MATIITKHEDGDETDAPLGADLALGELAVNTQSGKLWTGVAANGEPLLLNGNTGDGGNGNTEVEETQPLHGFSVLDCIRWDGTDWVKAVADNPDTTALGVVVEVVDVNTFKYAITGSYTGASLTANTWYFLDDVVAGGLTTTSPVISQPIIYSSDGTDYIVYSYRPSDNSGTTTGALPVGGTAGQVPVKQSGTDYDTAWEDIEGLQPVGGAAGQVLTKSSATDYDSTWTTPTAGGVTDHGALTGLGDNDHPQYANKNLNETISVGQWTFTRAIVAAQGISAVGQASAFGSIDMQGASRIISSLATPTAGSHAANKSYVDGSVQALQATIASLLTRIEALENV